VVWLNQVVMAVGGGWWVVVALMMVMALIALGVGGQQ
jgi:hypothetical protein